VSLHVEYGIIYLIEIEIDKAEKRSVIENRNVIKSDNNYSAPISLRQKLTINTKISITFT